MPLDDRFHAAAREVLDPCMGTENVGPLLYALACMRRPRSVLAVGIGYTTLCLLQALADVEQASAYDQRVLCGATDDPLRRDVLAPDGVDGAAPCLHAIDDFSDDFGRLQRLLRAIDALGLSRYLVLHRTRFQEAQLPEAAQPFGMAWIDCGHQLEYPDLCNRFWPLVDEDGGLLGMHYTHVDVTLPDAPDEPPVVIAGPWVNAAKQQMLRAGMAADFELLSLVEPHKTRQGSLTLLRKLGRVDRCRDHPLAQEQRALYANPGSPLKPLGATAPDI